MQWWDDGVCSSLRACSRKPASGRDVPARSFVYLIDMGTAGEVPLQSPSGTFTCSAQPTVGAASAKPSSPSLGAQGCRYVSSRDHRLSRDMNIARVSEENGKITRNPLPNKFNFSNEVITFNERSIPDDNPLTY
ncbi:Hypothetical protein NTJ_01239 [Nesidiocoris tenuis]|uniref:Uncharacterized protein n=1 Tax=Nesidiocoris tenuis TaxID=355587 RepID=A0ABN7A8Z9_9HEMI|nr:Hypothetical protein NTJ_01239 [Nesidiocoris tenuis]